MRILQVCHAFPPTGLGGAERYAWLLSRELGRQDEVAVFHRVADTEQPEHALTRGDLDGLTLWRVNNTFRHQNEFADTYRNDTIGKLFAQVLDEWRPEVVHLHHLTCLSTTLPEECASRGIPCVFTLHDYWLLCQRGQFLDRDLEQCEGPAAARCNSCLREQVELTAGRGLLSGMRGRRTIRTRTEHIRRMAGHVNAFIAPSRFIQAVFARTGWATERFVILPYGFDGSVLGTQKVPSGELRFGFIGSISVSKGAAVAVEAFRKVNGSHLRLTIHGAYEPYHGLDGYLDHVRALIGNDSRITLAGPFEYANIGRIFSEIDVLLFPSIWLENAPLTIQEAYLTGTPVLASDYGALPELVRPNAGGTLFRMNDPADLARCMARIRDDPASIEVMRRSLPEVQSIEANAAAVRRVYEKARAG